MVCPTCHDASSRGSNLKKAPRCSGPCTQPAGVGEQRLGLRTAVLPAREPPRGGRQSPPGAEVGMGHEALSRLGRFSFIFLSRVVHGPPLWWIVTARWSEMSHWKFCGRSEMSQKESFRMLPGPRSWRSRPTRPSLNLGASASSFQRPVVRSVGHWVGPRRPRLSTVRTPAGPVRTRAPSPCRIEPFFGTFLCSERGICIKRPSIPTLIRSISLESLGVHHTRNFPETLKYSRVLFGFLDLYKFIRGI